MNNQNLNITDAFKEIFGEYAKDVKNEFSRKAEVITKRIEAGTKIQKELAK
ncbi:MAG: hypothetical protein LBH98_00760 [Chitinispirillales bacterium]|jgi:hypothetical protein|nr:hypothetical protein [Chitinispirillales bacterium]